MTEIAGEKKTRAMILRSDWGGVSPRDAKAIYFFLEDYSRVFAIQSGSL